MPRQVPYVDLPGQHRPLKAELLAAVEGVLDSGQFILGPQVGEFETAFAELCGVRHAVGVNSGADALELALYALGLGPGDEIITAPNSFIASATVIAAAGARPVFADVREDFNLDPAKVEAAITPRTKALLPVHLTGRVADMDPLREIAVRHNLKIVEDAAQSVRAEYRGRRAGAFGDLGCFSLHPLKTLNACGDAGIVTTDDAGLAERLRLWRNFGLRTRDDSVLWGFNTRLDTLQAAILLVKLKHLETWTDRRRAHAAYYREALARLSPVLCPIDLPHERPVYHTFIVQAERRDELKAFLAQRGVGSAIHYPVPIHLQTVARDLGYKRGDFPVAERQAGRILSLPVYPELTEEDLAYVVEQIRAFYGA
ncbi:MAG: DegT/DnrJ/EryC1/StrS family aminotransferase [Planctomycetota bacterium]|nr:DegT/DnrJ/EryC1/StrS family aminotransferase [Planctomycetota bacterium]